MPRQPLDVLQHLASMELPPESPPGASNGHDKAGGDAPTTRAIVVSMETVVAQPLRWLWEGRIPFGKLTLLVGDPGLGKSFLTLDLASRLSTGTPFPGHTQGHPLAATVIMAAEDDLETTMKPRLEMLRADCARIKCITGMQEVVAGREVERAPRLDRDLSVMEDVMYEYGARLLVVDPINAYLGDVEGNADVKLRSVLTPLAALAMRTGAAVLAITHSNKSKEGPAIHRVIGSVAYVAAARSALAMGVDPDDPARRVVVQIKSNLAATAPGIGFKLMPPGTVIWDTNAVTVTADTVFSATSSAPGPEPEKEREAEDFLREVLAGGPVLAVDVKAESRQVPIAFRTLNRAKEALGVVSYREKGSVKSKWYWKPPPEQAAGGRAPWDKEDRDDDDSHRPHGF